MRKINLLVCLAIVLLGTTRMSAQATRTWVSGVGDDANPCSRTAPCKTFAGAISNTAVGGEIEALDPGGFGAVTITKSITIDGGGGQIAGVLVSGTNGIVVAAGANDVVTIRNLTIDGLGTGISGIKFQSGKVLNVEHCTIFQFATNGIDIKLGASGTANIIDTIIRSTGSCAPGSCTAGNGDGIYATTTVGTVKVTVNNTLVTLSTNNGIEAGSGSIVGFHDGLITGGNNGATATGGGAAVISGTTIAYNTGTAYNAAGGNVYAFATVTGGSPVGTNKVHDNGAVGTPSYFLLN